jgi:hypothetical protein
MLGDGQSGQAVAERQRGQRSIVGLKRILGLPQFALQAVTHFDLTHQARAQRQQHRNQQ